ncbi:MAG TPA: L-seryl-tRNA(Sec) selenium transferase [Thermoanaerobaculia bacterium]|nr:L-seryl-tRNA(Sec) selenium transferase [Thermoanaerobaculia bacterium]
MAEKTKRSEALRRIPSVEKILSSAPAFAPIERVGRETVKSTLVALLRELRGAGTSAERITLEEITAELERRVEELCRPSLRRVINGSGILIHTNLGRSPIDPTILDEAAEILSGYSNLEMSLPSGERGSRDAHIASAAIPLFGCEAALLTNNNAAGTLLLLAAVASGKEVIVSRGELVEIGGSFRIPEVIQQGGARLREVGTTNRTRKEDYASATSRKTAAILRVHRSNFEIVGFTERPLMAELVEVARARRIPLLYDEGSGQVVDLAPYGFHRSDTIRALLASGVDVITCSTDKLIGASQGGLILGRRDIIERCRRHPLMRALRAGKESYAVITATLRTFLARKHEERIPIYRMLSASMESLQERGERMTSQLPLSLVETSSALGGGTTPTESIASVGVEVDGDAASMSSALLRRDPAIIGRIRNDRLTLDLRTIDPADDPLVMDAIRDLVT